MYARPLRLTARFRKGLPDAAWPGWSVTTCQIIRSLKFPGVPSLYSRVRTRRNKAPAVIPAEAVQLSIATLTQAGTGTVRTRLPFPSRSINTGGRHAGPGSRPGAGRVRSAGAHSQSTPPEWRDRVCLRVFLNWGRRANPALVPGSASSLPSDKKYWKGTALNPYPVLTKITSSDK